VLASQWVDLLGYAAAGAVFATYSMKTTARCKPKAHAEAELARH
jgi:hypothetical protein